MLIVANGQTSLDELYALAAKLGADSSTVHELVETQFLSVLGALDAHAQAHSGMATPEPITITPPAINDAAPLRKRSLAAAKMYLLDMLGRIPSPTASAAVQAVRGLTTRDELLRALDAFGHSDPLLRPELLENIRSNLMDLLPD